MSKKYVIDIKRQLSIRSKCFYRAPVKTNRDTKTVKKPGYEELYGTDPLDAFFVQYIPLVKGHVNKVLKRDGCMHSFSTYGIWDDAIQFSYLYYRSLIEDKFHPVEQETEWRKYYLSTVRFKLSDYLNQEYLKIRYVTTVSGVGEYKYTLQETLYQDVTLVTDDNLMLNTPDCLHEVIKRQQQADTVALLAQIREYANVSYERRVNCPISKSEYVRFILDTLDLVMESEGDFPLKKINISSRACEYNVPDKYIMYSLWYSFLQDIRREFKEQAMLILCA